MCKGVHTRVHAYLYIVLTRCYRWHHSPLTTLRPAGKRPSGTLAAACSPCPAVRTQGFSSCCLCSAAADGARPRASYPPRVVQHEHAETWLWCAGAVRGSFPSDSPLGMPSACSPRAPGPELPSQGPEAAWPLCLAPAAAVGLHRLPPRWARHCQPHAMALFFDSPMS